MFYHFKLLYFAVDMVFLGMIVMDSVQFRILEHECGEAIDGSGDFSVVIQKNNERFVLIITHVELLRFVDFNLCLCIFVSTIKQSTQLN